MCIPDSDKHILEGEHGHWATGIKGLQRRHVKRIHIEWEDKPPSSIAELRLKDITKAMRLGFKQLDKILDAHAARLREQFDGEPKVSLGPEF